MVVHILVRKLCLLFTGLLFISKAYSQCTITNAECCNNVHFTITATSFSYAAGTITANIAFHVKSTAPCFDRAFTNGQLSMGDGSDETLVSTFTTSTTPFQTTYTVTHVYTVSSICEPHNYELGACINYYIEPNYTTCYKSTVLTIPAYTNTITLGANMTGCQSVFFTSSAAAEDGQWLFGDGDAYPRHTPSGNPGNIAHTYTAAGIYTATLTGKNILCPLTITVNITTPPTGDFTYTASPSTIPCHSGPVRLAITNYNSNYYYYYIINGVQTGNAAQSGTYTSNFIPGVNTISMVITNSICSGSITKTISVPAFQNLLPSDFNYTLTTSCTPTAPSSIALSVLNPSTSPVSYLWSVNGSTIAPTGSVTTTSTGLHPGSNIITLSTISGSCNVQETKTVMIASPESYTIFVTNTSCKTFSMHYATSAGTPSLTNPQWAFGDGSLSSVVGTSASCVHTYPGAGSYVLSLSGVGIDPCQTQTVVTVSDFMTPDFSYSIANLCDATQGVYLTIPNYSVGYTYQWQINNFTTPSLGATGLYGAGYPTSLQNGANVIKLTVTNGSGCSTTVTKVFNIGSPVADFNVTYNNCIGDQLSVFNISPGGGIYSWSITPTAGPTATAVSMNPAYTFTAAGSYLVKLNITTTLTAAGATSVCLSTANTNVMVHVTPNANFSISPVSCNKSVSVTPVSMLPVDYWLIDYGDGYTYGSSGNSSIPLSFLTHTYTPSVSYTMYPIKLTYANGSCVSEHTQNVIINNTSSLVVTAPTQYICRNEGIPIATIFNSNVSGIGPFLYKWAGPGGFTSTLSTINATADGVYNVTVTSTGACSLALTGSKTMIKLAEPSATVTGIKHIDCVNTSGSATLSIPNDLGMQGFMVNGVTGSYILGATQFVVNNLVAGTNYITVANLLSPSCNTTIPVVITHTNEPTLSVSVNQPIACPGTGTAVVSLTGQSGGNLQWFHLEGYPSTPLNNASMSLVDVPGSYVVHYTIQNCTVTANFNIISPVLSVSHISSPGACPGSTIEVTLNSQFTPGSVSSTSVYTLTAIPSGTTVSGTSPYHLYAGSYHATALAANGCTATHDFVISEIDPIKVSLQVNGPDCSNNGNITALASGGDGNYTYMWFRNGSVDAEATPVMPFTNIASPFTVSITVKDGAGCVTTAPAEPPLTIANYTPVTLKDEGLQYTENSTHIETCNITTHLKGGEGQYNYEWFKLEPSEKTVEWKFYYNNHGEFVGKTEDGPEVIVSIPSGSVDLSANTDHSLTTVAYPFWHFGLPVEPIMNNAGILAAVPNSTNPEHFYTVSESVLTPTAEVFVSSYSGISGTQGDISAFTSGDYSLHVTDGKGCRTSYPFPGLEFTDDTPFSMSFSYVWGMTMDEIPAPPVDPVLHENMIEAANELLEQQNACLARQVKQLNSNLETTCTNVANIKDALNLEYILQESHHTLYYYDRAGRLTKTVPPQGVDYMSEANIALAKSYRKTGTGTEPANNTHRLATTYSYNSFGQLLSQTTPDGGTTSFIYDSKNRLRFSQNKEQKMSAEAKYSYTKYDPLGRIIEVGESKQTTNGLFTLDFSSPTANNNIQLANTGTFPLNQNEQVTTTVYSEPGSITYYGKPQRYIQNRVSYTHLDPNPATTGGEHYTYYSYDSHGNVEWLVQDDPGGIGMNYMAYDYDLVSGKVLKVSYNEKRADRFYHRYIYDAENRLQRTETSRNGEIWDADASYSYYPHGPLKRNQIGEDHVQGLDYMYTIHGWIKSINAPRLTSADDPGNDNGNSGLALERTAADRFGMVLNYYNNDYTSSSTNFLTDGGSNNNYLMTGLNGNTGPATSLYNGNISSWVQSQLDLSATGVLNARADMFRYDILNRITQSTSMIEAAQTTGWTAMQSTLSPTADDTYKTSYSYDANGNILTLKRYDNTNALMDDLEYTYDGTAGMGAVNTNTLKTVKDNVNTIVSGRQDLQATHTYSYDNIGNLIYEGGEELLTIEGIEALYVVNTEIKWTVYGKIKEIKKTISDGLSEFKEKIEFEYDATGNRVKKYFWKDATNNPNGQVDHKEEITTWYVRDAQGNPMATYKRHFDISDNHYKIDLIEQPIYGSERIGQNVEKVTLASSTSYEGLGQPSSGFGEISEYQNWITTTSKTQLLPGGAGGNDNLCQCRVVALNGTNYNVAADAVQLLGVANNGVAVAEDLERNLQFFVVLAKEYLGGDDAFLVFDRDGHLMKGTESITSVDPNCKPIIVNLPGSKKYAVVALNALQQPVYHIVDMDDMGYVNVGPKAGKVIAANQVLNTANPVNSKHGLHFTGTEDHITGHAMVYANRYTPDANISGQGTTDIMAYDFGTTTLTPTAYTLHTVFGCANTETGQMQISPNGKKLSWWRSTRQLAGFTAKQGEILAMPLNTTRTALSGAITTKPIRQAGNFGNGMFDIMANNSDILFSQRGVYKDNSDSDPNKKFDRNVWKYTPVTLSSLNPNANDPMISYLFGEIKRGIDGNYYMPQMGASRDQIHAYTGNSFTTNINAGDINYKLSSALPTQVYKIFADPSQSITEFARSVGNKDYELKDHLGSVRVSISDAKIIEDSDASNTVSSADNFLPEVLNYSDMYAFGAIMPGRSFNAGDYRYGFGGKEMDNEVKGTGNSLDFGARINDPRLGRWLSVDPLAAKYPWQSPYCSMDNKPIWLVDPTGMGTEDWVKGKDGKIKWDENATSQETTKEGETYLGKAVVEFKGSRAEKLGTKNGKQGYIDGDGAITADVTVYGPKGADDIHSFKGYTMGSDPTNFGAIDEGLYDANYDATGKSGSLKSNWTIEGRGRVRMMDGKINPFAPKQIDENGEGYKDGIFIHSSNKNGYAGTINNGKSGISVGCLLIVPKDYDTFNKTMEGVTNFKVQLTRTTYFGSPFYGGIKSFQKKD